METIGARPGAGLSSARRTVSTVPGRPSVAHTWAAQYRIIPARVGLETAYLGPFLAVGAQSTLGSHTPRQWVSVPHTRPLSDPCACMLRIFVFVSVLKLFERPKEGSILPPPNGHDAPPLDGRPCLLGEVDLWRGVSIISVHAAHGGWGQRGPQKYETRCQKYREIFKMRNEISL